VEQITIRGTTAGLPAFPADMELSRLSSLGRIDGQLSRFSLDGLSLRTLDLQDIELHEGKVNSVDTERTIVRRVSARSIHFTGSNLGMLRWSAGKLSKTCFDDCKLLGAQFDQVILENVVFANCKLDYSTFTGIRASGPLIFVGCSLREVQFEGCDFSAALFDDCDLVLANFGHGRYKGCDLRGNDLSAVTGTHNLKSVVIDGDQMIQLAKALVSELDITFPG
jgi:uncharacterized protein YjbI with pentapeptide repeats